MINSVGHSATVAATAMTGINRGMDQMRQAAEDLARIEPMTDKIPGTVTMIDPLVAMIIAQKQIQASTQVLDADQKMNQEIGRILDERA